VPGANAKATGKEWTSSAPVLRPEATAILGKKKKPSAGLKTPSGGAIRHDSEGEEDEGGTGAVPADFFDQQGPSSGSRAAAAGEEEATLPEGFFDDPVQDAKARGIEYKVSKSD
jgi:hypothetical protein